MATISKIKKIFLGVMFVSVFVGGFAYSLKSRILKQEVVAPPKSDPVMHFENGTTLSREDVCEEENDEYLFVGCNGFL